MRRYRDVYSARTARRVYVAVELKRSIGRVYQDRERQARCCEKAVQEEGRFRREESATQSYMSRADARIEMRGEQAEVVDERGTAGGSAIGASFS